MITVYLCTKGDVFICRGLEILASPYGTDPWATKALTAQPHLTLFVKSLDEAIQTVLENCRGERSFGEWLSQLVRFKKQCKLAR